MQKKLHHVHALVFTFLLVSGFLLHFPTLRGPLAAYRLLIVQVHGWVGELFCLCLAFYAAFLFEEKKSGAKEKPTLYFKC